METDEKRMGILLVDKEEGPSSTDIDRKAKRIFDTRRVGHLGTLDPFATGLLVLAVGEATKALSLLEDGEKTYVASLLLGKETDTLEKTGKVVRALPVPPLDEKKIEAVLSSFLGRSAQLPPQYSAKRIDGHHAYDLVREGKEVRLKPIDIDIKELSLFSYDRNTNLLSFKAVVSKGTYIRSLGRDIASRLGTVGHLESLRRTNVGAFSVDRAKNIARCTVEDLLPIEEAVPDMEVYHLLDEKERHLVLNGLTVRLAGSHKRHLLMEDGQRKVAIYVEKATGLYHCLRGFAHD